MKQQKVYRGRRRPNFALPLLLGLVVVAGAAVLLVSCLGGENPAPADQSSTPESSATEPAQEQSSSTSAAPEEEESRPEAEQPEQSAAAAPVEALESDGGEIAPPADLAGFEHLFPAGTDDYRLVLVNKDYVMPKEFADLPLRDIGDGYRVHAEMYDALVEMMDDARDAGLPLYIVSGYRPMERSRVLYENKVQEYIAAGYDEAAARTEAGMWIAPPGTSEHATGLAVDLISADYYTRLNDLVQEFETFDEAKWLKAHCAEYGFILRFPKDKEDITQVVYEPWHFRYVGKAAAAEIMEQGITLEEYLGVAG